ncbi:MAG: hypothetical protein KAT32_03120, partial [Candidatus Moranbacteria bacterium]|nr:hypothetical protein [Candidatus Moranbacteria bacterium]
NPVFENVSAGVQVFGLKMGDVEFLDVRPKVVFNLGDGFPLFFINGNHRLQHGEIKNGFMTGVAFSF